MLSLSHRHSRWALRHGHASVHHGELLVVPACLQVLVQVIPVVRRPNNSILEVVHRLNSSILKAAHHLAPVDPEVRRQAPAGVPHSMVVR